ncbi:MAG: AraC family transcriptional regulator [Lachnospiraceae bacterium]|nr:AraC family transcriptional regulator [Lachnospiraceae bacterium]
MADFFRERDTVMSGRHDGMEPEDLNELEKKLKNLYLSQRDSDQGRPVDEREFRKQMRENGMDFDELLDGPVEASLMEDTFIPNGGDVAVTWHARYFPAIYHSHSFFEMTYVMEGNCQNYLEGTDLRASLTGSDLKKPAVVMRPGDLCLIAPGTKHAIGAFADDCRIINILIRSSTFETAFMDLLSGRDVLTAFFTHALYGERKSMPLLFHTGDDRNLKEFILYACEEYQNQEKYSNRMMNNLIHAICVLLLRRHEKDVVICSEGDDEADDNLIFIMNYIQSNYAHVSLPELAGFFHYSERHMSRIIKEHTGKRFSELTRDLKLHKAAELLHNPDLSLPEIVEQVGYADVSGFYRTFKNYYGVTPAEYRTMQNT